MATKIRQPGSGASLRVTLVTALTDIVPTSVALSARLSHSRAPLTRRTEQGSMHLEATAPSRPSPAHIFKKLEAAVILRGVVRLVLDEGPVEVEPRTWYREAGTHYLEAKRRDSGEHLVLRVDQIRDVMAY
jgi:hypothetical protein